LSPLSVELKTPRGPYRLTLAREPESLSNATLLTLALEHRDGIEKVAFQCRIDAALAASPSSKDADALLERLAPWVEREFETTRESALKSIRSERRLFEVVFDGSHRGPF
jgi:hypothetical protein